MNKQEQIAEIIEITKLGESLGELMKLSLTETLALVFLPEFAIERIPGLL